MTLHRRTDSFAATSDEPPATVSARERRSTSRGFVRPLERRDLEPIADIFLRVFRGIDRVERRRAATPAVVAHLEELYLDCPWYDRDRGSLVHVDAEGTLDGFLGSIQLPMTLDGTALTASAMGTFMVAEPKRGSGAAVELLRGHVGNGLDIHFTDTANRISLGFRQGMKFELLPMHSLEWVVALKPARLMAQRAARRWRVLPARLFDRMARPLDAPIRRMIGGEPQVRRQATVRAASPAEFTTWATARVGERRLRPDWTPERLEWLLDRASRRTGNGPLQAKAAVDAEGRTLGQWLVYAEPGSIASVLQVFARPDHERTVLEALIRDLDDSDCLAVRGTTEPCLMEALYTVPGVIFHHKGATALRSRHPEVIAAARAGDLSIGGLTGESWTRFVSDRF
jgi:hypothetical protein